MKTNVNKINFVVNVGKNVELPNNNDEPLNNNYIKELQTQRDLTENKLIHKSEILNDLQVLNDVIPNNTVRQIDKNEIKNLTLDKQTGSKLLVVPIDKPKKIKSPHRNSLAVLNKENERIKLFKILDNDNSKRNEIIGKVRMNYNVCQIFRKFLCKCFQNDTERLKNILYLSGHQKYVQHMNILNFISKMHEIDLIKYLLLDDSRINLFNFLNKPSISLVSKNPIVDSFQTKFNFEFDNKSVENLYKYYTEIKAIENKSDLDKKLLDIVYFELNNLVSE